MTNIDEFLTRVGQRALCNPPTLRNSYELASLAIAQGVPGDFVECGVFAGAQCAAMAAAIVEAEAVDERAASWTLPGWGPFCRRVVHAFDSFEGIPMAGPMDAEQPGDPTSTDRSGDLRSSGVAVCTAEQVVTHWDDWGLPASLLRLHPGWFQDTVSKWKGPIALLRLDGDLYESTRVCLEALYPHVSSGGYIIIDDYALAGCRQAVFEHMHELHDPDPVVHTVEGGGGPVWWRKP